MTILGYDIDDIFDDNEIPSWVKREFRTRESELFEKELIENVNEDGMARSDAFKLTDKAKEELLCELNINETGKSVKGLIKAETLAEKNLVYNTSECDQIMELSSILSERRFNEVQSRLRTAGMRPDSAVSSTALPAQVRPRLSISLRDRPVVTSCASMLIR